MEVKRMTADTLVVKLASDSLDSQKDAVCELRLFAKWDMDNRACIAQAGAIPLLVKILLSPDAKIQENAVTALLNLSIYPDNRQAIMESPDFLDKIFEVITSGKSIEAKQNSAALLFSLMVAREYRIAIGQKPGAIHDLLDLIRLNAFRAKKDAIKSLFHISLEHANRPRIVAAGAVPVLVSLLLQGKEGLVEDALAVLAQVACCVESVAAFRMVSTIPILVDILETGNSRSQENAASALLNLCQSGGEAVVDDVLEMNTCLSSLSGMISTGSTRAKSKASSLMKLLLVYQRGNEGESCFSSPVSEISTR